MKITLTVLRNLFRILVGAVFVFSGFVKGIDPLGTVYRMEDYFVAFNLPVFIPYSLILTIFLCTLEFTLGVSLLLNLWIRKTAWILLPMMIYFTIITFFDAFYNVVPDCGCFGDAIKMTNMQTFLKNIVLMAMVVPIFLWRKKYRSFLPSTGDAIVLALVAAAFTWMSVHCYRHLPMIDFMAWKVGNRVNRVETKPLTFYVTYKNKKTGEEKEYVSPNYPYNDSVWMSQWTFVSQRVDDPNRNSGMVLKVEDSTGTDYTSSILDNPDFHFVMVAYDLAKANADGIRKIVPLAAKAAYDGRSFVCLTSASPGDIGQFVRNHSLDFPVYNADDIVLKTMIRSNPGLILMKDGVVLAKWGFRDFPGYEEIKSGYMSELKPGNAP